MKKIIYITLVSAMVASYAYAEQEVTPPALEQPPVAEKQEKPKFKHCEKCRELRKKAREERMAERKARMEEMKKQKEEKKANLEKERKEWKGPVFCDECKEKFKDKKPGEWRKNRKHKHGEGKPELENGDVPPEACPEFKDGERRPKGRHDRRGKGKFGPQKDKTPPLPPQEEAPAEVE